MMKYEEHVLSFEKFLICMSCVFNKWTVIHLVTVNKIYLKVEEVKVKCENSIFWLIKIYSNVYQTTEDMKM